MVARGASTVYMHYSPTIPDIQTAKIKLMKLSHNTNTLLMLGADQKSELYYFIGFLRGEEGGLGRCLGNL